MSGYGLTTLARARAKDGLAALAAVLLLAALIAAFVIAPTAAEMGDSQRIFYFHVEASKKLTFAIPVPPVEGGFIAFLTQALTVAAKDVRAELRSREAVSGSLVFALLVLVIFNFAFDLEGEMSEVAGPGVLWVAIVLAGMMALGYVFAKEREQGGLQGLLRHLPLQVEGEVEDDQPERGAPFS